MQDCRTWKSGCLGWELDLTFVLWDGPHHSFLLPLTTRGEKTFRGSSQPTSTSKKTKVLSNKGSNKDMCDLHKSLNHSQPQSLKNKRESGKKDKLRNERASLVAQG